MSRAVLQTDPPVNSVHGLSRSDSSQGGESMTRRRLVFFSVAIQSVLCLTHLLLYKTWTFASAGSDTPGALWLKLVLGFLSVSFVAATLLAFRYTNGMVRAIYRMAAVWIGLVSFLFLAAVFTWILFGVARLGGLDMNFTGPWGCCSALQSSPGSTGFSMQAGLGSPE